MGSGKTSTSTQQVSIPPEVLARYNAVNARAEQVAQTPFQRYTGDFVAPLTGTQQAGIYGTSAAANLAQPFYGAGAGMTLAGAQNVGPLTQGQIAYYENPYIESVARPTYQALRQQQQEEMMGQTANAIRSGAFGGDRAGLVAANLARQQQLGMAQAMAPIYAQGYGQAVQTAAGQQGVVAQDLARQMAAGQQIAGLGTGAQQAALQGAQAQLAAGTAEQQTQQADLTARYNQFLQEQGYPFQVAQFLANIAMGTGALSGSTTTTQQPSSFFSDRRLKDNVEEIGKLKDGQKLYRYTMADGRTHIGLMADEVEKKHPDAVGLAGGYKTVDYRAATDDAARHKKAYGGGLAPSSEGGAVTPDMAGLGFARGGGIDDIRRMLTMHREMYPYGHVGLYGNPDARKGPYSSTMREINVPSRPLAPMTITVRPLNYAADVPAGVPQYASGGVVGYSQGGLPYSEASEEYVPEDISKPMTPASLKPAGGSTGPVQDPTVRDLMQMGRMAASLYSGMPFASGGVVPRMADGGPMDLDRVLAMQQQMYGSMGRPSGLNIPAGQARDPVKSMELMRPAKAPEPVKTGLQELQESAERGQKAYQMASGAYGAGKTALVGKAAVPASGSTPAQPAMPGLVGSGGNLNMQQSILSNPSRVMEWLPSFASGGVAGRLHYQNAGYVPSERELELENQLRGDLGVPQIISSPPSQPAAQENRIRIVNPNSAPVEAASGQVISSPATQIQNTQTPNGVAGSLDTSEENAARAAASRRAGVEAGSTTPSIVDSIRGLFPSLYPNQTRTTSGIESQPTVDQQQSLDAARRADRAIASQRRIEASRDLNRARYSGDTDAIARAQASFDEALRYERQFIEQNPPVRNEPTPQIPDADRSGRPPAGTNLPPASVASEPASGLVPPPPAPPAPAPAASAARTALQPPAPIEVGPVPGQGRPDVNEEVATTTEQPAPGVAGASPLLMTQPQAPTQAPMSGGSGGSGLLGAVASENFLVPLLTGLGAMASSPSRYLGSALLQGLGAGAQAYENVKTKAAERGRTEAEAAKLQQETAVQSFFDQNGVPYVMVFDENNNPMAIRRSEYMLNRNRYSLVPRTSAQPGGPSTVTPPAPPQARATVSPQIANLARQNAVQAESVNPETMKNDPSANPFISAEERALQARNNTPNTFAFAEAISRLPDQLTGPLQAQFFNPLFQRIVPLMNAAGIQLPQDIMNTQSAFEIINKMKAAMSSASADQMQQRAYQSIQNILNSIPSDIQTKRGASELVSTMIASDMIARDEAAFYNNYRNYIENTHGLTQAQSLVSGRGLSEAFNEASRGRLAQDKSDIQSLFGPLQARDPSGKVVDVAPSILSYMIKNAGNYDPNFEKAMVSKFGEDRARRLISYFSGARQ